METIKGVREELIRAEFYIGEMMREIMHDTSVFAAFADMFAVRRLIHRARENLMLERWDEAIMVAPKHLRLNDGAMQCLVRAKALVDAHGGPSGLLEDAIRELEHACRRARFVWQDPSLPSANAVRRVFVDTEFIEHGGHVDLVSVGMVRSDGKELYCVNAEADLGRAGEWVLNNVISKLPDPASPDWRSRDEIARVMSDFVLDGLDDRKAQLWGCYCAFDMVAICSVFGRYVDRPKGFPGVMHDIKTLSELLPEQVVWPSKPENAHHALADARWTKDVFELLERANARLVRQREAVQTDERAT